MLGWLTKTNGKPKQEPAGLVPTHSDPRTQQLSLLARFYASQVGQVYKENKILGRVADVSIAPRFLALGIQLDNYSYLRKAVKLTNEIGLAVGLGDGSNEAPIEAVMLGNLLVYRFVIPEYIHVKGQAVRLWEDVFIDNPYLSGGVGLGLGNVPVYWEPTGSHPHTVVVGTTGSGKSELIRTLLYQLMKRYTPDELGIALVDPKSDFGDLCGEEHLLYNPVTMPEDIKALIRAVHEEYRRRKDNNLRNERKIVLMIDEANHEITLLDQENYDMVHEIGRVARVFRIYLLIGTHGVGQSSIGDLANMLTNKFYGLVSDAGESGRLNKGLALHKLGGRGDFYFVQGDNKVRFQGAMTLPDHIATLKFKEGVADITRYVPQPVSYTSIVLPERKPAHRPKLEVDMKALAYFVYHGPDVVQMEEANNYLDLKRAGFELHRKKAAEFVTYYEELQREGGLYVGSEQ